MSSPFYRGASSPGRSGPGVSADGYDGAESFFEQLNTVAGELNVPGFATAAEQSLAAKTALNAYMTARNGTISPGEALFYQGNVPAEFPEISLDIDARAAGTPDLAGMNKAVTDLITNVSDIIKQAFSGPIGMLGQLLSFIFKLFTDMASEIAEAITELARAATAAVEDALKKQLKNAAPLQADGLQPLELFNQAASTQTLAHSLRNSASN